MDETQRIEEDRMTEKRSDGRDELNLAEFPLCALAHRLRPDQKTLEFEDRVWDERRGDTITRRLLITGSDAYGLPTALDDEVLLGLIQITKLSEFVNRAVRFTRYQLIQLLGWRNESKSYERIEASLNRWTGVTLYYRNAWWNKARECWVDEKFHVLDNVRLFHRESANSWAEVEGGCSVFVWNDVIFRNFQAGNLKSLDFDFFRELRSAIARRLYRFLDKRFFRSARCEFDLREFACEHAGLSRNYDTANLKRKLSGGIAELEQRGFLAPLSNGERFSKVCSGRWRVAFERGKGPYPAGLPTPLDGGRPEGSEAEGLVTALTERGVSVAAANEAVRKHAADQIKAQIDVFDWMVARRDPKVSKNPPGFLVSAIKRGYVPPQEFAKELDQARAAEAAAQRQAVRERDRAQRQARQTAAEVERENRIAAFWQAVPEDERPRHEAEAMAQARNLQRQLMRRGGKLGESARKAVLDAYALARLEPDTSRN